MSTLRFVREEKTNVISFQVIGKEKITRTVMTMNDFSLALFAGKEVQCSLSSTPIEIKKKKAKAKK